MQTYAGIRGKAVKGGFVDEQNLRGFGQGQDHQPVMDGALLHELWDKGVPFLLCEIVPVIH